ncbi:MAG: DUF3783 domain-containing protein, partial [Erysipelotrichaceae bacterium]|nr:DUF3783 domain-containing protein [Erysipelotrichaceae bacterium]
MNETILYYHLDLSTKEHIIEIASQLDIKVREIFDNQVNETMGYLLHLDGYELSSETKISDKLDQPFLFFAFMSDKQLDLLLEIFKVKEIPYIPYKA